MRVGIPEWDALDEPAKDDVRSWLRRHDLFDLGVVACEVVAEGQVVVESCRATSGGPFVVVDDELVPVRTVMAIEPPPFPPSAWRP